MTRLVVPFLLCVLSLTAAPARGALMLTMSSNPSDLSNLDIGNQIDITVALSGLAGGEELIALGGTVIFPAGIFGTPFNAAAGSIVPDPADLTLTPISGAIDGQFFAFMGGNIASNGDFFSFRIQAGAPGSGVIAFDPLALFAIDAAGNTIFDIATNQLPFTVRDNGTTDVPEPATLYLLSLLLVPLGLQRHRRINRGARPVV